MSPNRSRSPGPAPPAARGALPFPGASFVAEPRGEGGIGDAPISKAQPPPRAGSLSPPLISLLRRLFSWQPLSPAPQSRGSPAAARRGGDARLPPSPPLLPEAAPHQPLSPVTPVQRFKALMSVDKFNEFVLKRKKLVKSRFPSQIH